MVKTLAEVIMEIGMFRATGCHGNAAGQQSLNDKGVDEHFWVLAYHSRLLVVVDWELPI